MRQFIFLSVVLITVCSAHPVSAQPASVNQLQDDLLNELNDDTVEYYWQMITTDYGEYLPALEKTSFRELIKQQDELSLKSILISLSKFLLHELILNSQLLGILLLLTIFSVTLQT